MRVKKTEKSFNPNIVEYEIVGWAKLKSTLSDKEIKKNITQIKKNIYRNLLSSADHIVAKKSHIDLNMKSTGLISKGKTYIACTLFLYLKNKEDDLNILNSIVHTYINNVFDKNEDFSFTAYKTDS